MSIRLAVTFGLLLSSVSTVAGDAPIIESKYLFESCRAADIATTAAIIHTGGVELNPIMASVIAHGWLAFVGVEVGIGLGVWYAWDYLSPSERVVANVLSCIPPVHNLAVMK